MLKKFSVKTRLMTVLAFAGFNVLAVGLVAVVNLTHVLKTYDHVVQINMISLKAINGARNAQRDVVILVSNVVSSGKAAADADKIEAEFQKASEKYEAATADYLKFSPAEGEASLREAVTKGWKEFEAASASIVELAGSATPEDLAKRAAIDAKELTEGRKHFRDSFGALVEFHEAESTKWAEKAKQVADFANKILLGAVLVGCVLLLSFGYKVAQSLTEILMSISGKVNATSQTTMETSQQVSSASDQLASSSTQQASSLQETASSMEEINAMVTKNADSAQKTQQISEGTQKQAILGKDVVLTMVASIDQINQSNIKIGSRIEQSNQEMAEIIKVIAGIETKTKVINDIVFQTKLLSFNASVEAARAGEHGKGFAVVAEEVGNLAQMSGDAAQSISTLLQESSRQVEKIIQSSSAQFAALMGENKEKIKEGVEIAERCKKVLESLVNDVSQVNGMANDIAMASNEQAQGVREVNSAVAQLDSVVQQNSSATQNLSSAAQSLLAQTETLNSVASELSAVIHGAHGTKDKIAA